MYLESSVLLAYFWFRNDCLRWVKRFLKVSSVWPMFFDDFWQYSLRCCWVLVAFEVKKIFIPCMDMYGSVYSWDYFSPLLCWLVKLSEDAAFAPISLLETTFLSICVMNLRNGTVHSIEGRLKSRGSLGIWWVNGIGEKRGTFLCITSVLLLGRTWKDCDGGTLVLGISCRVDAFQNACFPFLKKLDA